MGKMAGPVGPAIVILAEDTFAPVAVVFFLAAGARIEICDPNGDDEWDQSRIKTTVEERGIEGTGLLARAELVG